MFIVTLLNDENFSSIFLLNNVPFVVISKITFCANFFLINISITSMKSSDNRGSPPVTFKNLILLILFNNSSFLFLYLGLCLSSS